MSEAEQQAGDVGRDVVEEVAVIGDQFTFLGRGRVVRTSAREDRRPEVSDVGAGRVGRRARKAGGRTPELALRAVEVLTDGGLKLGEVVEVLSGRCAVPRRTVSDIKRRIRERRKNAAIVAQAVRAAQGRRQAERRAEEEREAVRAAAKEYERLPMAAPPKRAPEMNAEDGINLATLNRSFRRFGQAE